ncbi:hypothetical protein BDFB_015191, partial [Asbolus verrucosus]
MITLNSDSFQPKNVRQIMLVQPALKFWKMIYNTLLSAVGPAVFLWVIFPILSGEVKTYGLPFVAWYPYNYKASPYYELTYLHQIV